MAGFADAPFIQQVAVPAVSLLIASLGYGSQIVFVLFSSLDPGPLSSRQTAIFNALLLALWITYYRSVTVDPGRYVFHNNGEDDETGRVMEVPEEDGRGRWCRRCEAPKPPRAHHCRHCGRCVPKMDHHCPWTRNCVSMTTFPHFLRFLVYANVSLWTLGRFIWLRFYAIYERSELPAYLGPTLPAMVALSVLSLVWFVTTFVLGIMLATTVKGWLFNNTMIEGWQIDRHEAAAERSGREWWDVVGPDGKPMAFEKLEFPYDVGIFGNMAQAMGTRNLLLWFFPLAGNPQINNKDRKHGTGWTWPENGFNRETGMWPPPDPDKLRRAARELPALRRDFEEELRRANLSPEETKRAFQERQERDLARRRRMLVAELEEVDDGDEYDDDDDYNDNDGNDQQDVRIATGRGGEAGRPSGWVNTSGERLRDYGVDEDAEDIVAPVDVAQAQDDDVPLAELLRRRRTARKRDEDIL